MRMTRHTRQLVGWFACLAILLGLAAPTITHALPARAAGDWITVCTSVGMKLVQLDAAGQAVSGGERAGADMGSASHGGSHCAFCVGGLQDIGLPPAPAAEWALAETFAPRPPLYWSAPRLAAVWASARPRGPPSIG